MARYYSHEEALVLLDAVLKQHKTIASAARALGLSVEYLHQYANPKGEHYGKPLPPRIAEALGLQKVPAYVGPNNLKVLKP